ncbi:YkvA family protein [Clostridium amazonitimonense]|uniref:YkvA family protein n=1 Tax=Clostridium amazonitimonense TaxID=1499689 RepID=UPI000509E5BB|nr:YkvA family protein [Clostridium amazonitimonense]
MREKVKTYIKVLKIKGNDLKKEVMALYLAYKKNDVPWYAKVFVMIVVGYALSPIDLIPDFIPILGYLDDIILIPLGVSLAIKMIPKDILEECRKEAEDIFKDKKPKNWVAAAVITVLWVLIIIAILHKFIKRY